MNNEKDDVQVLFRFKGHYYTLEPKENVSADLAREKRLLIFGLFKDHHTLREVVINQFKWKK